MTDVRFEREVPAVGDNVRGLRQEVAALAARHGGSRELVQDVALAVSEACTNVVVHAYARDPEPGTMRLSAHVKGAALIVRVADVGLGMVPRTDSPGLGLGLPLVAQLTERCAVRHGPDGVGTELCMRFSLDHHRSPAAYGRAAPS